MISEKRIEQYLVRRFKSRGGKAYKFISPSHKGVPDRLVFTGLPHNPIIFVEVKREQGKLSLIQKYEIKQLREMKAEVYVVYSVADIDNLIIKIYENEHEAE